MRVTTVFITLLASLVAAHPKASLDQLLSKEVSFCRAYLGRIRTTTKSITSKSTKTVSLKSTLFTTKTYTDTKVIKKGTLTISKPKTTTTISLTFTPDPVTETSLLTTTVPYTETVAVTTSLGYLDLRKRSAIGDYPLDTKEKASPGMHFLPGEAAELQRRHSPVKIPSKIHGYDKRAISSACSKVLNKQPGPKTITVTKTMTKKVVAYTTAYTKTVTATKKAYAKATTTIPVRSTKVYFTSSVSVSTTLPPVTETISVVHATETDFATVTEIVTVRPEGPCFGSEQIFPHVSWNPTHIVEQRYDVPSFLECRDHCRQRADCVSFFWDHVGDFSHSCWTHYLPEGATCDTAPVLVLREESNWESPRWCMAKTGCGSVEYVEA